LATGKWVVDDAWEWWWCERWRGRRGREKWKREEIVQKRIKMQQTNYRTNSHPHSRSSKNSEYRFVIVSL